MAERVLFVTGSRTLATADDRAFVAAVLDRFTARRHVDTLVHGGANGVDMHAHAWAQARSIPVRVVRPQHRRWSVRRYPAQAYTLRDCALVDEADWVVAVWDGHSAGTQRAVAYANEQGKLAVLHRRAIHD